MKRLLILVGLVSALLALGAVAASVATAGEEGPSSYLCWNHEMTSPVAYLDSVADEMWLTGKYYEPQAVLGVVEGGTNIGAYHLVCNAPETLKITDLGIGGSGEVYGVEAMTAYHADHPGTAHNDLNVYHIYK